MSNDSLFSAGKEISHLQYRAGPTATKFHLDNSKVRALVGPVGCGKSVTCCMEILRIMSEQEKGPDGFRRTRIVCIRNSYSQLLTTTLKTWKMLFPTPLTGRLVHGMPIVHYFEVGDIRSEVLFLSINSEQDISKLRSLEATLFWINEAQYLFRGVLDLSLERTTGRYPPKEYVKCTRHGVILDTNAMADDHWFYKLFEQQKLDDYKVFHYPPALIKNSDEKWVINPKAENLDNLGEGANYYLSQVPGKTEEYIKVMLCGQYGTTFDGRPVFSEYNDLMHYDANLKPVPELPIMLAWDFGLTPCCAFIQFYPNGQMTVIDELTTEYSGIETFVRDIVLPYISKEYPDYEFSRGVGDPSGTAGNTVNEKITCFSVLKAYGLDADPSPDKSNNFLTRREAVSKRLINLIDGKPAFILGFKAQMARKGYLGGYFYRKIKELNAGGEIQYKEFPEKNKYSHIQDAIQYACVKNSYSTIINKSKGQESRENLMLALGALGNNQANNFHNKFGESLGIKRI